MTGQENLTSLIRDKYNDVKEFNKNPQVQDIYDLTPHSLRYNILKYTLKTVSLPFSAAIQAIKFITFGSVSLKYFNIGNTFLNKINEGISKKILQGLPEVKEGEQTISEIVAYVLKKCEEKPELIQKTEPSLLKKFTGKLTEYIPSFSKLINFWNQGGIEYSLEMTAKQELVASILKIIISTAYNVGKKGKKLEISEVKELFPEINFKEKLKDAQPKEIEVVEQPVACELPVSEKCQESAVNLHDNPLVKLMMVKALYDEMQKMAEIYEEHCIVEQIYSDRSSIIVNEQYYYDYPQVLGAGGCYTNQEYGNSLMVACY